MQHVVRLAVVLLGFAALRMGSELDGLRALAAIGAIGLSCWPARPRLSARGWLVLQIAFLLWLLLGAGLLHRHLITLFAELLVFVQIHRLLARVRAQDDFYLAFISFGQVLITSVLTIDVMYLLLFATYVVAVAWLLLLAQIARGAELREHSSTTPKRQPPHVLTRLDSFTAPRPVLAGLTLAMVLLAATATLFFILPRMQASFLEGGIVSPLHVSGFAERVRLGDLGSLKLSSKPVMRVRTHDRKGNALVSGGLYWHGLALDRFDGRGWELSAPERISLGTLASSGDLGPPRERPWTLRQEITLEPLDSDVLFFVPQAAGIYGVRRMEAASTEGYYFPGERRGSGGRLTYTVYSNPEEQDAQTLRGEDPSRSEASLLERYTQLPSLSPPRIAEIAADWTQGAASAVDSALIIQDRLRREYSYSLDQEASAYSDPILAFLDEVKEGHCEYYATAMTLLLRTRGIPSRLVNGFYGGEWNPVGEYWLIRQRDAHSWVEVWFPESGWVIFDPTPSVGTGLRGRARIRLLARLSAWTDYAELLWKDVLLDYGLDTQAEGVRSLFATLQSWGETGEDGRGAWTRLLAGLAAMDGGEQAPGTRQHGGLLWGFLALAVLVGVLVGRSVLGFSPRKGVTLQRRLRRLVLEIEASWRRSARGGAAAQQHTSLDWARWAAVADPERFATAPELIERYYQVRFGSADARPELFSDLRRLRRVSRSWRPSRPTRS
jgi:transglutaminase-like putative cysteine protease